MPRLWNDTIEEHRKSVRDATLDTTAALVSEQGLSNVTMSQIANETGIGRATLYKYFPDIESILIAWHERQVEAHLAEVSALRDGDGAAIERLTAVLERFALSHYQDHESELVNVLHHGSHVVHSHDHLTSLLSELIREGSDAGDIRDDASAGELATYCLCAVTAANGVSSKAAVRRLVMVTVDGLRTQPPSEGTSN